MKLAALSLVASATAFTMVPAIEATWQRHRLTPEQLAEAENSVTYAGCDEVRAAGLAPLYRGTPGYRTTMDGDGDGIACEPIR